MKYIKQKPRRRKYLYDLHPDRQIRPQNFGVFDRETGAFPIKILFLNLRGVISPMSEFLIDLKRDTNDLPRLWKPQMKLLEAILWNTGASVILTDDIRKEDTEWIRSELEKQHFKFPERFCGEVLSCNHYFLGDAIIKVATGSMIEVWLDSYQNLHPGKKYGNFTFSYAILDYRPDILYSQRFYFVQTDEEVGLTEQQAIKVINILNDIK